MTDSIPFRLSGFEDPFSSLSHLLAAVAFALLTIPLIRKALGTRIDTRPHERTVRVISLGVFAASAVLLLTMSGVFHMLTRGGLARDVLQRLDHACIFILIAGTCTPIQTILYRGRARSGALILIWTIAALGVTLKSIFFKSTPAPLSLALYLGLGWSAGISIFVLWRRHGLAFIMPLLLGGLAYTIGAAVEWIEPRALLDGVIRAHELFHLAVIAGLGLQWKFIWSIAASECL